MQCHRLATLCWWSLLNAGLLLAPGWAAVSGLPRGFQQIELMVEGTRREALVYAPDSARDRPAPLVFVWHGHGGSARGVVRMFALHQHWPEAISVYPQGLNTPGRLVDPEGRRPGWQGRVGDQGDRDLKFFDALLARLRQDHAVDNDRIYSTGHSNGGGFTYLLWAARGEVFAAVAPSGAGAPGMALAVPRLRPKPAMHLAGEKDPLVKYEWQQAVMAAVRRLNGCVAEGKPWDRQCLLYESRTGTPFVSFIHPGGHEFPREAPALIVKFFQQHARSAGVPGQSAGTNR